ncbi:hypothetical protein FRB93_008281 [Tulasnella sp. JGI-2019a]|nr:hypothetical protein FRB93_008281 [Tulasnella sp. JGI-2019a]
MSLALESNGLGYYYMEATACDNRTDMTKAAKFVRNVHKYNNAKRTGKKHVKLEPQ